MARAQLVSSVIVVSYSLLPNEIIDRIALPDGKEMVLLRADGHIAIHVGGRTLMSSLEHGSEDALGRIVGEQLAGIRKPRVLIGGLGLGFTLRAALDVLPPTAKVVVAELLTEVVRWHRGFVGALLDHPLDDPRVKLIVGDVGTVIAHSKHAFDAIVLDVDNGPEALTHAGNATLYGRAGLSRARIALRAGGVLAVWSAFPSRTFARWMKTVGTVKLVRTVPTMSGGPRYYIWLATRS
ncbi:MAG: hypothetical protein JWO36_3775 [Myxococcales bacterium]|nr:hypothetical protein [Myxococcales bacterium]